MTPVALRTERLDLTVPVAADVDAIVDACQDDDIQRYTTVPSPYARRDAEDFVQKVVGWWAEEVEPTWAIRREGGLVGMISLHREDGSGAAELGYWIAPWARRRGYVTAASEAVIDWGFSDEGLGLMRLEWRAVVGNIGSARAASAVGFRYEGLLRQQLVNGRGERFDTWVAGLLATDDRVPRPWPVLGD